ncbi:MAG: hypothetical protein JO108_26025 [Acidobacteriaceae bacterium]|nr:hypothetical protein [Acidobacteriaceae bacterium]
MDRSRVVSRAAVPMLLLLTASHLIGQNLVILPVQVSDAADRPVPHVILSAKGDSTTSAPTDKSGKTHIALPATFSPGSQVALVLVESPSPQYRFLSPWEGRAVVPAHDAVEIVLGVPGDPGALNNPQVRQSLRNAINAKAAASPGPNAEDKAANNIAAEIGLNPTQVMKKLQETAQADSKASSSHHQNPHQAEVQKSATNPTTSMQSHGRKHQ